MKSSAIILMLLIYVVGSSSAQIGISNPGRTTIARDSFSIKQVGKSSIQKCSIPGTCNSNCAVYTFIGAGNWNVEGNWEGGIMPPTTLTGCVQIIINPTGNQECLLNVPLQIIPQGASVVVMANKKFRLPGKLIRE